MSSRRSLPDAVPATLLHAGGPQVWELSKNHRLPVGPVRLHAGSMFVGLTNRGWSSLGTASYGLQRLVWTGKVPFEIKEMRARPDGFELVFTRPVEKTSAADPASYEMNSYTYLFQSTYGSDEIQKQNLVITSATVSEDGVRVRLAINNLRELFVHELTAPGVRSQDGESLLHPHAYYTLNRIPGN